MVKIVQREHMVNRVSSYFPKGGQSATQTKLKKMNKRKVKRHRNSDTKKGNIEPQQNYRLGTVSNGLLGVGMGGLNLFYGDILVLRWTKQQMKKLRHKKCFFYFLLILNHRNILRKTIEGYLDSKCHLDIRSHIH